jgi:asparagine synthetase B (glutamine-hydrolysing)
MNGVELSIAGVQPQVIALPQWYSRFDPNGSRESLASDRGVLRAGPFTVYRAGEGCELATFGNPSDPGVVLFDGYLFNRRSTKGELGIPSDGSDAAIAAAAYERWGREVFDRLDGSFLVAVWDPRERRLFLGHDALGHHPAFYAQSNDGLWFSANVLALPAARVVSNAPNRVSLGLAALMLWPAAGETFFEHVRRLRPGHYLSADAAGTREIFHWSPWLDDDDPGLTEKDAWDRFEPTLIDAIDRCMELAPEGIMLSGGLDSVTIAALAADYAKEHAEPLICAVSGRRDFPPSDEEPMQTAVAGALGMRHIAARESEWLLGRPIVDLSLEIAPQLPGPSRIYWVGGYVGFYRHVAAQGVHVALTGSGGDNWVSVADAYAAHAMRRGQLGEIVRHMRSWMGTGGLSFKSAAQHLLWSGGLRLLLDSYGARWVPSAKRRYHRKRALSALPAWLSPDPSLKDGLAETLYQQRPAALTPEGRVPRNFYRHSQRATINPYYHYEFEFGFHVESLSGLCLLSPYHDKRVVRFLNSIPPQVLLHGENYKGMLRPVAEKRLPDLGLGRQRKIYEAGVRSAQGRELREGVLGAWTDGNCRRLAALGVVDEAAVSNAFAPTAGRTQHDLVSMYALLSADRWLAGNTAV